jgi:tRNA threonylcarbamoyladenosine modification (KEOPS) complex Cgi121 subunit
MTRSQKLRSEIPKTCASIWRIQSAIPESKETESFIGFCFGYTFRTKKNLKDEAEKFPEGTVLCSSGLVAGKQHIEWILRQAAESWAAGSFLAKNKSIDLLIRISCQRQITKALQASALGQVSEVIAFGLPRFKQSQCLVESRLVELGAIRNDQVIDLDDKKVKYLLKFHRLPRWITPYQLPGFLLEKSASLVLL